MQYKADLRLFDSRLHMKTRGTGAPSLSMLILIYNTPASSLAPLTTLPIIRGFAMYSRAGLTLDRSWLEGCEVGRAVAGIGMQPAVTGANAAESF
jgi:hypothetical protein